MNKLPSLTKRTSFVPSPVPPKGLPPLTPSPVRVKTTKSKTTKFKTKNNTKTISELPVLTRLPNSPVPRTVGKPVRKQALSGHKDADLMILSILNDKDLFSLCMVDKYTNKLCKDEIFWRNRFVKRFGDMAAKYKPKNRSWRNHYLKVVSDLDLTDPWSFLDELSWIIYELPENTNVQLQNELIIDSDEKTKNRFWLLEMGKEINLKFPQDRYDDIDYVKRRYKSDTQFTPAKILKLVYDFYNEPISRKELEMMQEEDVEFAEDYELEDADKGEVLRGDVMGNRQFFEGFGKEEDSYVLSLGS